MLDRLHRLLREGWTGRADDAGEEIRVATAALLFHILNADGVVDAHERTILKSALKTHFELSDQETRALVEEAEERDRAAIDLYGFTSVVKANLDREARLGVVELIWHMVFADDDIGELEDNLVWRIAELLGVDGQERIALRQRVAARSR